VELEQCPRTDCATAVIESLMQTSEPIITRLNRFTELDMREFFERSMQEARLRRALSTAAGILLVGVAAWGQACVAGKGETYGPYEVIGDNYTDRGISRLFIDGHGVGSSYADGSGGGGGIYCCHDIPKHAKTLHIKVELEWTKEQYEKHSPHDTFETDIPVPPLPDKHDGFIEFHFLPRQRIDAAWVSFPTIPHIPGAH